ncbi:hypothetical protein P9112_012436 [Eukaryota sp. TZLM1-RC]
MNVAPTELPFDISGPYIHSSKSRHHWFSSSSTLIYYNECHSTLLSIPIKGLPTQLSINPFHETPTVAALIDQHLYIFTTLHHFQGISSVLIHYSEPIIHFHWVSNGIVLFTNRAVSFWQFCVSSWTMVDSLLLTAPDVLGGICFDFIVVPEWQTRPGQCAGFIMFFGVTSSEVTDQEVNNCTKLALFFLSLNNLSLKFISFLELFNFVDFNSDYSNIVKICKPVVSNSEVYLIKDPDSQSNLIVLDYCLDYSFASLKCSCLLNSNQKSDLSVLLFNSFDASNVLFSNVVFDFEFNFLCSIVRLDESISALVIDTFLYHFDHNSLLFARFGFSDGLFIVLLGFNWGFVRFLINNHAEIQEISSIKCTVLDVSLSSILVKMGSCLEILDIFDLSSLNSMHPCCLNSQDVLFSKSLSGFLKLKNVVHFAFSCQHFFNIVVNNSLSKIHSNLIDEPPPNNTNFSLVPLIDSSKLELKEFSLNEDCNFVLDLNVFSFLFTNALFHYEGKELSHYRLLDYETSINQLIQSIFDWPRSFTSSKRFPSIDSIFPSLDLHGKVFYFLCLVPELKNSFVYFAMASDSNLTHFIDVLSAQRQRSTKVNQSQQSYHVDLQVFIDLKCYFWTDFDYLSTFFLQLFRKHFQNNSDISDISLFLLLSNGSISQTCQILSGLCQQKGDFKRKQFFSLDFSSEKGQKSAIMSAYNAVARHHYEFGTFLFILGGQIDQGISVMLGKANNIALAVSCARVFDRLDLVSSIFDPIMMSLIQSDHVAAFTTALSLINEPLSPNTLDTSDKLLLCSFIAMYFFNRTFGARLKESMWNVLCNLVHFSSELSNDMSVFFKFLMFYLDPVLFQSSGNDVNKFSQFNSVVDFSSDIFSCFVPPEPREEVSDNQQSNHSLKVDVIGLVLVHNAGILINSGSVFDLLSTQYWPKRLLSLVDLEFKNTTVVQETESVSNSIFDLVSLFKQFDLSIVDNAQNLLENCNLKEMDFPYSIILTTIKNRIFLYNALLSDQFPFTPAFVIEDCPLLFGQVGSIFGSPFLIDLVGGCFSIFQCLFLVNDTGITDLLDQKLSTEGFIINLFFHPSAPILLVFYLEKVELYALKVVDFVVNLTKMDQANFHSNLLTFSLSPSGNCFSLFLKNSLLVVYFSLDLKGNIIGFSHNLELDHQSRMIDCCFNSETVIVAMSDQKVVTFQIQFCSIVLVNSVSISFTLNPLEARSFRYLDAENIIFSSESSLSSFSCINNAIIGEMMFETPPLSIFTFGVYLLVCYPNHMQIIQLPSLKLLSKYSFSYSIVSYHLFGKFLAIFTNEQGYLFDISFLFSV